MLLNQVFELSMILDDKKFKQILSQVHVDEWCEDKEEYSDNSMADKGIIIRYRESQYKKKIKLIFNLQWKPIDDAFSINKVVNKLDKSIRKYFKFKYNLNDFKLSGMIISNDVELEQRRTVEEYLRVFRRIGKVKNYVPIQVEGLGSKDYYHLQGNSNGVIFMAYNLESAIRAHCRDVGATGKKEASLVNGSEGVLRFEIRLDRPKAIRTYTKASDTTEVMKELMEGQQEIFMDVLKQVIPFGDFYKKNKAMEIIQKEVKDKVLRRKMFRLVVLIPEKKSLHLAQKSMSCNRDMDKIMGEFARINLSPITLSKRQSVKFLKSIYYIMD